MAPAPEYLRSVELIWLAWLAGLLVLLALTRKMLRDRRAGGLKRLVLDEDGAAYSISYVMVFPLYLLLVCLVVEATLLLVVKLGTMYAAYAGGRSAVVWLSADPDRADDRCHRAAVQALAPFASSSDVHAEGFAPPRRPGEEYRYALAYKAHTLNSGKASAGYLTAKYRYAARATTVKIDRSSEKWDADVTIAVTYHAPLRVPGVSLILGRPAPWPGARFRTYPIESRITLRNEAPKNDNQTLGVDYYDRD
jgi:Flp pilus assembly protein TadG